MRFSHPMVQCHARAVSSQWYSATKGKKSKQAASTGPRAIENAPPASPAGVTPVETATK
jgi:hypothetical protein